MAPAIRPIKSHVVALNYYNYSLHIPVDALLIILLDDDQIIIVKVTDKAVSTARV